MDLAPYIEHTRLAASTTPDQVETLCAEAVEHGLFAVCVPPLYVSLAERCLRGRSPRIVTVVGFPLGSAKPGVKAAEAREAVHDGADELDMVMAIGPALGGDWDAVEADVRRVRESAGGAAVKVIVETGYLRREELRTAAEVAVRAGAQFVKTCTGYGPRGATVDDVRLLCEVVRGRAEVKASGGIRTAGIARQLIGAGATRIGTSNGLALVKEQLPGG